MTVEVNLLKHIPNLIEECFGPKAEQRLRDQPLRAPELLAAQSERCRAAEQDSAGRLRRFGARQHAGRALLEVKRELCFRDEASFVAMRLEIHGCVSVLHRLPMKRRDLLVHLHQIDFLFATATVGLPNSATTANPLPLSSLGAIWFSLILSRELTRDCPSKMPETSRRTLFWNGRSPSVAPTQKSNPVPFADRSMTL
ncbi:hypothetical protein SB861_34550 [Paraburkholderia sp. SIMBA_049]